MVPGRKVRHSEKAAPQDTPRDTEATMRRQHLRIRELEQQVSDLAGYKEKYERLYEEYEKSGRPSSLFRGRPQADVVEPVAKEDTKPIESLAQPEVLPSAEGFSRKSKKESQQS